MRICVFCGSNAGVRPEIAGFFDPLLQLFAHAAAEGFIEPANLTLVSSHHVPASIVDQVVMPLGPVEPKWLSPADA